MHGIYIIGRHGSPRCDIFRKSCEFHSINEKKIVNLFLKVNFRYNQ